MKIKFTKMHGLGNDYIYINEDIANKEEFAIFASDRHFGVGSDGVVLILESDVADAKMRMFNADGSEGNMCGNAIRCVGKYLYDNNIVKKDNISIETLSGIKYLELSIQNDKCIFAKVNMGKASIEPESLPVLSDTKMIDTEVLVDGNAYKMTCVSMGNPHAVIFVDDIDKLDLAAIGPSFEHHKIFPQRVNTEFVKIIDSNTVSMRVWERGSGETLACGTGASAVAVACVLKGIFKFNEENTVKLLGGDLKITVCDDMTVYMNGPATKVFEGEIDYEV